MGELLKKKKRTTGKNGVAYAKPNITNLRLNLVNLVSALPEMDS